MDTNQQKKRPSSRVTSLLLTVLSTIAWTVLLVPHAAATEVSYVRIPWEDVSVKPPAPTLADRQAAWLAKLVSCESLGDPAAVNPKDRDGTPSYGLLQFKPSTFAMFSRAYGIGDPSDYMDPKAQKAIVLRMMRDRTVDWHQQFPVCVQRYGLPPSVVA